MFLKACMIGASILVSAPCTSRCTLTRSFISPPISTFVLTVILGFASVLAKSCTLPQNPFCLLCSVSSASILSLSTFLPSLRLSSIFMSSSLADSSCFISPILLNCARPLLWTIWSTSVLKSDATDCCTFNCCCESETRSDLGVLDFISDSSALLALSPRPPKLRITLANTSPNVTSAVPANFLTLTLIDRPASPNNSSAYGLPFVKSLPAFSISPALSDIALLPLVNLSFASSSASAALPPTLSARNSSSDIVSNVWLTPIVAPIALATIVLNPVGIQPITFLPIAIAIIFAGETPSCCAALWFSSVLNKS